MAHARLGHGTEQGGGDGTPSPASDDEEHGAGGPLDERPGRALERQLAPRLHTCSAGVGDLVIQQVLGRPTDLSGGVRRVGVGRPDAEAPCVHQRERDVAAAALTDRPVERPPTGL